MSKQRFDLLIPDLNGIFRGLSAPLASREKILADGFALTGSLFTNRFDGKVVEECGYGVVAGDPDYPCVFVSGSEAPVPWQAGDSQAVFTMNHHKTGAPFVLDPQNALASIIARFAEQNIEVVAATELEFFMSRGSDGNVLDAHKIDAANHLYSNEQCQVEAEALRAMVEACEAQGIATENIVKEYGHNQWEITTQHKAAARACLEGLLLRRAVRLVAAQHGRQATFMAKPHGGSAGNGMHINLSLWRDGNNLFTDTAVVQQAIAGIFAVVSEAMALFAPFANSYRRFVPGNYAPTQATYGDEDRNALIRIPHAQDAGEARLEFRLCGADANPFLAVSALLAGIHYGMTQPRAYVGSADVPPATFPTTWQAALEEFAAAKILPQYMDAELLRVYHLVKQNELAHCLNYVSDYDKIYYAQCF